MKTYIIEYEAISEKGVLLKAGKMKVKNKASSIQAQVDLEKYLKRKVAGFGRLVVKSCNEEGIEGFFDGIFGHDPWKGF